MASHTNGAVKLEERLDLNTSSTVFEHPNHVNGSSLPSNGGLDSGSKPNGTSSRRDTVIGQGDFPIAICGMALRLPGGLESPQQLWDFLIAKEDARAKVPESRYNISSYYSSTKQRGAVAAEYGYFLDDSVKLGAFDASRFSFNRGEVEAADPQHRLMLEVARECLDDAGEVNFKGRPIGCYIGSYGEDWMEIQNKDPLQTGSNRVDGYGDFMLSNRVSYEMDLQGPRY